MEKYDPFQDESYDHYYRCEQRRETCEKKCNCWESCPPVDEGPDIVPSGLMGPRGRTGRPAPRVVCWDLRIFTH